MYLEVSQAQGGGGGTLCPLHDFYIHRPIAMKFGTDVIHVVPSKFLKVTMWERISTKCDQNEEIKNYEQIWHTLKESNV